MVTKDKIIRKGENDMLSFESDYTEGAHEPILKLWRRQTGSRLRGMELIPTVKLQRKRLPEPAAARRQISISYRGDSDQPDGDRFSFKEL